MKKRAILMGLLLLTTFISYGNEGKEMLDKIKTFIAEVESRDLIGQLGEFLDTTQEMNDYDENEIADDNNITIIFNTRQKERLAATLQLFYSTVPDINIKNCARNAFLSALDSLIRSIMLARNQFFRLFSESPRTAITLENIQFLEKALTMLQSAVSDLRSFLVDEDNEEALITALQNEIEEKKRIETMESNFEEGPSSEEEEEEESSSYVEEDYESAYEEDLRNTYPLEFNEEEEEEESSSEEEDYESAYEGAYEEEEAEESSSEEEEEREGPFLSWFLKKILRAMPSSSSLLKSLFFPGNDPSAAL